MKIKKITIFFGIPLLLFFANAFLIWPLFLGGYTQQMGSIETVFMADAKFILENFPHLSWNQYWYTGFPFHLFYTPLLPALMALFHAIYPVIELASWYRIIVGVFYAAIPVSVYFFVRFITGKTVVGFLASLIFSFVPTLAYQMSAVGSMGWAHQGAPWRFLTLIFYGEGGHIMGLFFIPLALLFFIKFMRVGGYKNLLLASTITTLLALTNMIALIGFGVMLFITIFVEIMEKNWAGKFKRAVLTSLFSFGLSAFWYNLSFMKASVSIGTGGASGGVGQVYLRMLPLFFLLSPVIFILAAVGNKKSFKPILMALGWVVIFYLSAHFWFSSQTMLLPQPNRYVLEMDMGVSLILAWVGYLLVEKVFSAQKLWVKIIPLVLGLGVILWQPLKYTQAVWELAQPAKDITQTAEYQTASWLEKNTQGSRVYATGSTAFWLNTFANVPQIRGGNDGLASPRTLDGVYQINTGENAPKGKEGEVALGWLRIFNTPYIVINTPNSREYYHDYLRPERFTNNPEATKIIDLNGDEIYKITLKQPSLAQVVKKAGFDGLKPLKNAVDTKNLERYVNYIDGDNPTPAEFSWTGVGRAKIKTNLKPGEGVAVQIAYNPGWKAYIDNKSIPVKNDIIGFVYLDIQREGDIQIDLVYKKTWDVWLGYLITLLTVAGLVYYSKIKEEKVTILAEPEKKVEDDDE